MLTTTAVVLLAQPIRSPWWTYADADATYTAASLNLMLGVDVRYLDHPGLPLEQVLATTLGAEYLFEKAVYGVPSRRDFVDERMVDLDRTRAHFRTLAILFYLAGTILSFVLLARLFCHWAWGLAGSLLWLAAPALIPLSIRYRPDVLLAVLALVFAYLLARAVERRSAAMYGAAAVLLGFAVMVKMHALGLVVPLALAAVWKPPAEKWARPLWQDIRRTVGSRRSLFAAVTSVWVLLALLFNYGRFPFTPTREQLIDTLAPFGLVAAFLFVSVLVHRRDPPRVVARTLDPFYGFVGAAFLVGLALPVTLSVRDGLQSFVSIVENAKGGGVNQGVEAFAGRVDLLGPDLRGPLLVFALSGIAAVVGLVVRDPRPLLWFLGAAVLGIMAYARVGFPHYFAPAFMVALPGALWLFARARGALRAVLVPLLVVFVLVPPLRNADSSRTTYENAARDAAPSLEAIEALLRPGEVALTPYYWPHADPRYYDAVQGYVNYSPPYPYRFVPSSAVAFATEREWRIRFYTGPEARDVEGTETVSITAVGDYTARPLPGVDMALELLSGPGVTAP